MVGVVCYGALQFGSSMARACLARYCMRMLNDRLEVMKLGGNFQYCLPIGRGTYRIRPKIPVCHWYTTDPVVTNEVATKMDLKKARKSTNRKRLSVDELEPVIVKKLRKSTKKEKKVLDSPTDLDSHVAAPQDSQELDKKKKTRKSRKTKDKPTDDVIKKKRKRLSKTEKLQDSTSEDATTEGKKRKGRRKKVIVEEEKIGPFIPFEGIVDESHTFHNIDRHKLSEGRFYSLQSATENYLFPSVTTVLDNTMDSSSSFRLLVWRRNLIKLHGQKDFEMIAKNTLNSGANFHKVSATESRLSKLTITMWYALLYIDA